MKESSKEFREKLEGHVEATCGASSSVQTPEGKAIFVPTWSGAGTGAALDVASLAFRVFVSRLRGLAPTSRMMNAVVAAVTARAMRAPIVAPVRLVRVGAAEGVTNWIAIHLGDGVVLRLSDAGVDRIPNGSDGVVFRDEQDFDPVDPASVKVNWPAQPGLFPALEQALLADLPPPAPDSALTDREQRAVVLGFYLGIFIGPMAKARPILFLLGPHGCGKTTVQRVIATLFFGALGDVGGGTTLDRVMKDLAATSVHRSLVVRDDVNDLPAGAADVLCRAATGTTYQVAEFNETLQLATYRAHAALALSAFQPSWMGRADLNSRLLVIRLGRPPTTTLTERQRRERALALRPAVWAETLAFLSTLLDACPQMTALTRFDDWELAVRRMLRVAGLEDEFVAALRKMDRERERAARDGNPDLDVLAHLANDPAVHGRWWWAQELADLQQRHLGVRASFGEGHLASALAADPKRLGEFLHKLHKEGTALFDVHRSRGHDNKMRWAITPKGVAAPPVAGPPPILSFDAAPSVTTGGAGGTSPNPIFIFDQKVENVTLVPTAGPSGPPAPPKPDFCEHCGCSDHLPAQCPDTPVTL